ncbi:chondroitin sulfate synthase 1 [Condylostylus longicornis]|uniref:chondroitin sulfate synthase 1 n=1 Tax=Condylostylus longicornis TaxID=2530218 RepID=UPI00244DE539|nr:chondroitin sulfate synthase 1 [Condylostylus longicornis]XP_055384823.1 chondroitin sulfate synthase 1 [Condylostylus longicornis]XP_055384824.1 chondroitin sulfate synthase 1 [Condylostylus longicornis]
MKKRSAMSKRKTFIFSCFGIAIGLCIGTVFKNYRALEIVKRCKIRPTQTRSALEIIGMSSDETIYNSQKNFVFVGVMTAKNFLNGRAKAVFDTWGKEVPGRIAFFSSEGSYSSSIPVIDLKNVDDRYPPQKKSFMMLYYMYEHFIDKFEWFIRADDDVYMDVSNLEEFLRSIDSSKPQFIGQAGKGNNEEFGLLSLEFDENFCMGGPGVILSRETLRRVAPHIPACLKNLYSTHEDVEIGRCVQKFAGIPCTWNYEMQYIMRHNSSGKTAFTGSLKKKDVNSAISLHPVKQAPLMYRLHSYIQGLKAHELRQESLYVHRDIIKMSKLLSLNGISDKYLAPGVPLYSPLSGEERFEDHTVLGISPDLNKFLPNNTNEILTWEFIARSLYSAYHSNPKRKIDGTTKEGLEDAIIEIMEHINNFSRQRGRVIEFRELLYGYSRLNPVHGQDLILDLLLIYKKYRGKKMTVPVRRHLYIQRSFTSIFVKEFDENFFNLTFQMSANNSEFSSKFKNILNTGFAKISNSFSLPVFQMNDIKSKIAFTLPIKGRIESYKNFIRNYEKIAINSDHNCNLLVIIFGHDEEVKEHIEILKSLKSKHAYEEINFIRIVGNFSRGLGLDKAVRSSYIKNEQIIFFIDVDMSFTQESLDRIRLNTIEGKQVYLPIVFSEYNKNRRASYQNDLNERGFFRQFGFGICSIYKSDIMSPEINGLDIDIYGWGLEDVKFLEKIIANSYKQNLILQNTADAETNFINLNQTRKKLHVFRSPDPSLVHVYHEIDCDFNLEALQYDMCLGTKANTLGNTNLIEEIFLSNEQNIDYILKLNGRN